MRAGRSVGWAGVWGERTRWKIRVLPRDDAGGRLYELRWVCAMWYALLSTRWGCICVWLQTVAQAAGDIKQVPRGACGCRIASVGVTQYSESYSFGTGAIVAGYQRWHSQTQSWSCIVVEAIRFFGRRVLQQVWTWGVPHPWCLERGPIFRTLCSVIEQCVSR